MRFSLRTSVQVILFFALVIFLNGYIVLFYDQKRHHSEYKKSTDDGVSYGVGNLHKIKTREVADKDDTIVDNSTDASRFTQRHHTPAHPNPGQLSTAADKVAEISASPPKKRVTEHQLTKTSSSKGNKVNSASSIFNPEVDYILDYSDARPTELSDIFISVKTTKRYHKNRLDLLLNTWVRLAKDETYFFTDGEDKELQNRTRGHVINTNCSAVHSRAALCCKMAVEYDYFIASNKRWFCHVDDDTYINIPELSRLLKNFNHTEDWYLGKPSLNHPLEITDPEYKWQKIAFWFATGGAGMCISRSLALKMMPYAGGGRLINVCSSIRLPDDCTIGFIIYNYLKKELTVIPKFHSHLEGLWLLQPQTMDQQITLSYSLKQSSKWKRPNIIHLSEGFDLENDPTRFRSIHCRLFPYLEGCPQAKHS